MSRIANIIGQFSTKKVLVLGDVMLDKYIWGIVERISPEDPVQIVRVTKESYAPGGAANVASNIASLGGQVTLIGLIGHDDAGVILQRELEMRNIQHQMLKDHSPTTQKVRIIGHSQQLLRFDYENNERMHEGLTTTLITFLQLSINEHDAVVVSDYAKGVVGEKVMAELILLCKNAGKPLIIDPKPKHKTMYAGATLITPNHKEASEMAGIEEKDDGQLVQIGAMLSQSLQSNILITRGEKGMSLFQYQGPITHIPTKAREVYDVVGAGDTVVGVAALALAAGASLPEAAAIANHAAGVVVGKIGTSTCSQEELIKAIDRDGN